MSIFTDIKDKFSSGIANMMMSVLMPPDFIAQKAVLTQLRDYREGKQKEQLKVKQGFNDNITMNFCGLVIDRSVSMLFGKGITFDYENETVEDYINQVFDANRKEILLHKIGLVGSESGTWYCKIIPDGKQYQGKLYPRLVILDPKLMSIETLQDDIEKVIAYNITYVRTNDKDKTELFRERTSLQDDGTWLIESGILKKEGRLFEVTNSSVWDYEFPPIIHGQNLINVESPYGEPDVTHDTIDLQDRVNFVSSNVSKIIRLHAHPILIGKGFSTGSDKPKLDVEPGKLIETTTDQEVYAVEMQSDLTSSQQYLMTMRQALFDTTRTVDISSMNDKLGALTNFGLRVLYQDALAKNETKKQLYGDALMELCRRLLILNNMEPEEGHIEWPDPLPVDEVSETAGLKFDLDNQLVSKETASGLRGYVYENEQLKIDGEKSRGDNIGAALLANFDRG